jgi:hypothetical protein
VSKENKIVYDTFTSGVGSFNVNVSLCKGVKTSVSFEGKSS